MAGNQYFVVGCALKPELAVSEMARFQRRIDANFIFFVCKFFRLVVAEAKTPGFLVIRGAVRNPIRRLRQGEKVLSQFRKAHLLPYWHAVIDDMQIAFLKIDHPFIPREFLIYASRMFHSFGTTQSKTGVPLGTSCSVSGTCFCSRRRLSRTPSPVMLRQIGYNAATL